MSARSSKLIGISSALGGFGALFYIGHRVWKHMANGEGIDFYPLLRPFTLILLIGMFPTVLDVLNGVLEPLNTATSAMASDSKKDVETLLKVRAKQIILGKDQVLINDPSNPATNWGKYATPGSSGNMTGNSSPGFSFGLSFISNSMSLLIKLLLSTVLQLLYYAAAFCIDLMRSFHLALLAILGPIAFALSVYDGFTHTLVTWLARYINVFLWLPICNLFSDMIATIQAEMLKLDIAQIETGGEVSFSATDATYIIFLMIAIIGYFSVPSIAGFVVQASGGSSIMARVNRVGGMAMKAMSM